MFPLVRAPARRAGALACTLLALAVGCSDGGQGPTDPGPGGPPSGPPASVGAAAAIAFTAGDGQTADPGAAVPVAPAARVVDQRGNPVPNVAVTFAVTAGGGRVANATATSGADGVAAAGAWTLGGAPGDNVLTATVAAGAGGAPSALTATARATARGGPRKARWTVMVYMAADNTLAVAGVNDIDKMEAAGSSPDVQTVVQAEFSPTQFARANCGPECANLRNFETFRYQVAGGLRHVKGPDGPVTTLGNRDMTDPAQLREFVAWAKQTAPAEHYALVLWNHGGGYVGLLEDETSRPHHMMSLAELKTALAGAGGLDVLDFDMCLMGGYETLAQLAGIAKVAVFSEEVEPSSGVPYTELLKGLAAEPTLDARGLGALFVRAWDRHYRGGRESTTQSAYDLAGLPAFEQALGAVAGALRGAGAADLRAASAPAQRYAYPWLADVGDLADKLAARADAGLRAQLAALKARATAPEFRIANYAANGTGDTTDVTRSTGLHVLMPAGDLPATGSASFAAYRAQFGGGAWTQFLDGYLNGAATSATVDQGERPFQSYLVWDSAAVSRGADVDLWVLEPNGNVYVPWRGTVTPNGHLSADSEDDDTFYEGYATNRHVQKGTYRVLAYLYDDPQNFRPRYDLLYRFGAAGDFASLYEDEPEYPRLSKARPMKDDASPSWDKVTQGAYSDLQLAGTYTAGGGPAGALAGSGAASVGGPAFSRAAAARSGAAAAGITPAQLATLRRLAAERHAARRAPAPIARSRSIESSLRALVPGGPR
jgi:hypothetical protein